MLYNHAHSLKVTFMNIKSIIFDMDGTIVKSLSTWSDIIASLIGRENIGLFLALRAKAPGKGIIQTTSTFRDVFNIKGTDEEIAEMYEQRVKDFFNATTIEFIDGFKQFHSHLTENNIATSLATDSPNHALDILKPKLNLSSFFGAHIYNSCAVGYKFKPDPSVFLHALEKLEQKPDECIIFEDSREGVAAAKRAGIMCIGVNSHNNIEELGNADYIIDDYNNMTLEKLSELVVPKSPAKQQPIITTNM